LAPAPSQLSAIVYLAGWLANVPHAQADALAQLPTAVVHYLGLDLEALAMTLPDAEMIRDISSLQG
jgi:hypothetical protein